MTKSTPDQIRQRFDNDVERFSNLQTGQSAQIDSPLILDLISSCAAATNPTPPPSSTSSPPAPPPPTPPPQISSTSAAALATTPSSSSKNSRPKAKTPT